METISQPDKLLGQVKHRPCPPPNGPWAISMRWHDLLFMHWPMPEGALRPLIPPALELDSFDGSAWLGVVPFRMTDVRPHFLPAISPLSNFPEINLRTYVTAQGKPGIWFFSLDAHNPVAVRVARATYRLPYFDARMSCRTSSDEVHYESVRTHRRAPEAKFAGRYRPSGEVVRSEPGTLEDFLTERYCLYAADRSGRVVRGEIHHQIWPLQHAEAEIEVLNMTGQIGLSLPEVEPVLHFARYLEVVAWLPKRIT